MATPLLNQLSPSLQNQIRSYASASSARQRSPASLTQQLKHELGLLETAEQLQLELDANPEASVTASNIHTCATRCQYHAEKLLSAMQRLRRELGAYADDSTITISRTTPVSSTELSEVSPSVYVDSDGSWSSPRVNSMPSTEAGVTTLELEALPGFDSPAPPTIIPQSPPHYLITPFISTTLRQSQRPVAAETEEVLVLPMTSSRAEALQRQRRIQFIQSAEFADLCPVTTTNQSSLLDPTALQTASLKTLLSAVSNLWTRMRGHSQAHLRDAIQMGQLLRALYPHFQRKKRSRSGKFSPSLTWKQWLRTNVRASFVSISLWQGVADIAKRFPGLRRSNWVLYKIQKYGHAKLLSLMIELDAEGELNPQWKLH